MIRNPFRFYDVPPPPPTYFGGTLPEVMVSSDEVPYPYYNQLTPEERSFFNDEGSIGRGVRSIAMTGKRGQTYSDLSRVAKDAESFAAEMTGIPGSIRFAQDPVKKLKGAGRTIEATILGSSPFIASPYNQEDVADTFDALDAFGFATLAFAPLKTPLQQGIKSSGRYLTQGPLKNAYRLNPKALKEPNLILTRTQKPGQTADLARLDELLQKQKLTKAEEIELVKLSQPGYGRGFDLDPNRINYYANPNIQSTRKYSGMPEIRVTSLPAEEAAKFNVGKNTVKGYRSLAPKKEFLLPRNYVESSRSFMPKTLEELDQLIRALDAEKTALSTPHWLRGYPRSLNTQPLASNNVDLRRLSNPRSIWDQLFNIKRPEQFLPTPLNAKDELARANADALAFSQSPYNRAKLQRFRQGQDFDVTNTEALFSNDPLARERFDKLMKDDPNFLNYKNIENWQGAAEGNYGAKNFGDMDDLAIVNKGIPQSKIYDAAIHEMGHSRSVRLPATVEERAILDDAWKPLQEPDGSPVPFLEAEAVQGELRMMLGDKLGKRVYTQKDAGEIKKALEKMVANDHPYVHIRNINDFDIPKIIKSLNEIGLAGFAGGVVAPKLLKNDKKGKK